jgi:amino acid transporter
MSLTFCAADIAVSVYDVTAMDTAKPVRLVRAVGLPSLTAIAINGIIGAGIFVLPAAVARILGPASLSAYLLAGLPFS